MSLLHSETKNGETTVIMEADYGLNVDDLHDLLQAVLRRKPEAGVVGVALCLPEVDTADTVITKVESDHCLSLTAGGKGFTSVNDLLAFLEPIVKGDGLGRFAPVRVRVKDTRANVIRASNECDFSVVWLEVGPEAEKVFLRQYP